MSVRKSPVLADWRWVARGTLIKLVALSLGTLACLVSAIASDWEPGRILNAPNRVGMGMLFVALAIDVCGRLLCLATPQSSTRWWIVLSVFCQLLAITISLLVLTRPAQQLDLDRPIGFLLALSLQGIAAFTFTGFLFAVGVYFRNRSVMVLARIIEVSMAGLTCLLIATGCVVLICALFIFLVFTAYFGYVGLELVGGPIAKTLAIVLLIVELAYAATLATVCWELWLRKKTWKIAK
jgi:hypothetical protein